MAPAECLLAAPTCGAIQTLWSIFPTEISCCAPARRSNMEITHDYFRPQVVRLGTKSCVSRLNAQSRVKGPGRTFWARMELTPNAALWMHRLRTRGSGANKKKLPVGCRSRQQRKRWWRRWTATLPAIAMREACDGVEGSEHPATEQRGRL